MKKWQIAVSILLVFALGTAVGAYGSRAIFKIRVNRALHTTGTPGIRFIQSMVGRLDLSDSQRTSIKAILDENNKKWEALRQEYEPKIKELFENVIEETKKVLTPEQRKEVEQMSANVQRRLPPRSSSQPRTSAPAPPEGSSDLRSSEPPEATSPRAMSQPPGPKSSTNRVGRIIEALKLDKDKSVKVQSIISAGLEKQKKMRGDFQASQTAAEERFQKETTDAQLATEKELQDLLTPEQMETYRQMITRENPHPDDFGFDNPDEAMDRKDFKQDKYPAAPEGQKEKTAGKRT